MSANWRCMSIFRPLCWCACDMCFWNLVGCWIQRCVPVFLHLNGLLQAEMHFLTTTCVVVFSSMSEMRTARKCSSCGIFHSYILLNCLLEAKPWLGRGPHDHVCRLAIQKLTLKLEQQGYKYRSSCGTPDEPNRASQGFSSARATKSLKKIASQKDRTQNGHQLNRTWYPNGTQNEPQRTSKGFSWKRKTKIIEENALPVPCKYRFMKIDLFGCPFP